MSEHETNKEINFSDVNWNKLSKEEFRNLEVLAQKNYTAVKNSIKEIKKKDTTNNNAKVVYTPVNIDGTNYLVTSYYAKIYSSLTGEKRSMFEKEIKQKFQPIEEL